MVITGFLWLPTSCKRILKIRPGQKAVVASGFSLSSRVKDIHKLGAGEYVKKHIHLKK